MSRDPYDGLGGYDHWKTTEPDYEIEDCDEPCFGCGGAGVLEDECECMAASDQCYCLNPRPPVCPECNGNG